MQNTTQRQDVEPAHGEVFLASPQTDTYDKTSYHMTHVVPEFIRHHEVLLSDDSSNHRVWKPCEHYKCSAVQGSGLSQALVSVDHIDGEGFHIGELKDLACLYDESVYGTAGRFNTNLPAWYIPRLDGGFVPPPSNINESVNFAVKTMMPIIKAELSVVNTLIELKDFKTLPKTILGVKDTLSRVFLKPRGKGTLRSMFRTKADVYLQYKFNIATLLSDIHGIYRALARAERRINDFISRSGRIRTSHYTKFLIESADPVESDIVKQYSQFYGRVSGSSQEQPGNFVMPIVVTHSRFVKTEPAQFHVQVQYNYNYTAYQVEHARILALLDAFGVNLNPAIIWNAIPWSFVIDWVVGVGRYLDAQKVGNMDPKINILQCLWSFSRKRRILVQGRVTRQERAFPPYRETTTSIIRPSIEESAYRRSLFVPDLSSITSSGLSLTEISLGAALVVSRRRRPRSLRR
jgi:hypothetical protein